jgi:hypothetical protein
MAGLGWCPREHIDEIMGDVDRLIKSVILGHTDESNVNMHFDELRSELKLKLAKVLSRRDIFFVSREKFFGFLKVSLVRHLKSHTQKHVYTYKRTGPKVEHDSEDAYTGNKPGVLCLDSDETGAHNFIGEDDPEHENSFLRDELETFIKNHLTTIEAQVIRQEYEPNEATMDMAMEASRENENSRTFRILDKFKAAGINLPLHVYKRTLGKIRVKVTRYWTKA